MTEVSKKQFTPQEANKRLPLVKQIVQDILANGQQLKGIISNTPAGTGLSNEGIDVQAKIKELMQELEDLGCYYKDWNFEIGLVDFPALINGEPVFLCWRSDENDIRYYHNVDENYENRQAIPQQLLN